MKKTVLLSLAILFLAGPAWAEEMVVQLKSGNALRIQYTGSIQGVSLDGKTDAIEAMNLQPGVGGSDKPQQLARTNSPEAIRTSEAKSRDGGFRFRWAEPRPED